MFTFTLFIFFFAANHGSSNQKLSNRHSLYNIEFTSALDNTRDQENDGMQEYQNNDDYPGLSDLSSKPMTPRRVKRRSIMTRGTNVRHGTSNKKINFKNSSSKRKSKKSTHQNLVTNIVEELQMNNQPSRYIMPLPYSTETSALTISNLQILNKDIIIPTSKVAIYQQTTVNPDPIYYNMNTGSHIQQTCNFTNSSNASNQKRNGYVNESFQNSIPNLSHSPEPEEPYYRSPSARSSYSNFHGARSLGSYNSKKENLFINISDKNTSKTISQVPRRQNFINHNTRNVLNKFDQSNVEFAKDGSLSFLNTGPPAYNLNYHTPPESEIAM